MSVWGDWRTSGITGRPHELPLFLSLPNGELIRIFCLASDLFADIKNIAWQAGGLKQDSRDFIFRLPNAEAHFFDTDTLGTLLEQFLLFREPGFVDVLRVTICERKDVGDAGKRHTRCLTASGYVRIHGLLQKRGTSGVHKWQQRYFALQDNTLFNFGSQEEFDKRFPASEVVPMGSCLVTADVARKRRDTDSQKKGQRSEGAKKSAAHSIELPSSKRVNLEFPPQRSFFGQSESFYSVRQPSLSMFCLQAASVGKREFWFRTHDEYTHNDWVQAIRALNLQRVKRVILDVTREASSRGRLLRFPKEASKEAEKVMAAYAYGLYPKLSNVDDFVLAEIFAAALALLDGFLWPGYVNCGTDMEDLKSGFQAVPMSSRALLEHIFLFLHRFLGGPNGTTGVQIAELMAPLLFEKQLEGKKLIPAILEFIPKLAWTLDTCCHGFIVELPQPRSKMIKEAQTNKVTTQIGLLAAQKEDLKNTLATTTDDKQRAVLEQQLAECRKLLTQMVTTHIDTVQNTDPEPMLPRRSLFHRIMSASSPPVSPTLVPEMMSREPPPLEPPPPPPLEKPQSAIPPENAPVPAAPPSSSPVDFRPQTPDIIRQKFKKTLDARNRLCFPLHFQSPRVVVRVVEELQAVDGQPFTPGRFYYFDDLISEQLGNRVGCSITEVLPPQLANYAVTYDYFSQVSSSLLPMSTSTGYPAFSAFSPSPFAPPNSRPSVTGSLRTPPPPPRITPSSSMPRQASSLATSSSFTALSGLFVPEPVCMAYLGQCNLLAPLFQLSNYLANRPPVHFHQTSGDSAWEPRVVEQERRRTTLTASPAPSRKRTLANQEFRRRTSQHLARNLDADDFVDIDTAAPPQVRPENWMGLSASAVLGAKGEAGVAMEVSNDVVSETKKIPKEPPLTASGPDPPEAKPKIAEIKSSELPSAQSDEKPNGAALEKKSSIESEKIPRPIRFELDSKFEDVIRYQESRACFLRFLASEHADENLLFWEDVRIFLQAQSVSQHDKARHIYATYLAPDAPKPVNVRGMSAQVAEALESSSDVATQCSFLFLEAQHAVVRLMKYGSFPRFLESPMWEKFVADFHKREWVRMKVVKMSKLHRNEIRILEFDSDTLTITFYKPDHTGAFCKVDIVIPAANLLNVQLSVESPKKLKISFFKNDFRQLRNQKEWRVIFRTNSERERLARLITSNLVLKRSQPLRVKYQPVPLVIERDVADYTKYHLPVWEAAAALHETWLAARQRAGWTLGDSFSEEERTDPELVPFPQLPRKQQEYHMEVASLTMGCIIELGYKIAPQDIEAESAFMDLEEDSRLLLLVEFLSENAHDCWAANKMKGGWKYGPTRSEEQKTHPNLVHFVDLDEADKDWNRHTAQTVLRTLMERGFMVEAPESGDH